VATYRKIIIYNLIFICIFCGMSYAENAQLRTPIGSYSRLGGALSSDEGTDTLVETRFKEVMGPEFGEIRDFYIDKRTGRYVFQKELKNKKEAWITYSYENSLPVGVDGKVDDLMALYDESSGDDEDNVQTRYLVFKRLARYRETAFHVKSIIEQLSKKEMSKKVLDEIEVALNMISGKNIDGRQRLNVVYTFYELSPFVGRGGVKDVAKELPRVFRNKRGNNASVFIPYWHEIIDKSIEKNNEGIRIEEVKNSSFKLDGEDVRVYSIVVLNKVTGKFEPIDEVPIYLLKCDRYFSNVEKGDIYRQELDRFMPHGLTHPENALTAVFFSKAVLEAMKTMKLRPDIINAADWQAGQIFTLLKKTRHPEAYKFFRNTKTAYTVHNIGPKGLTEAYPYAPSGSYSRGMWDFMEIADDAYQPPDQNGLEFYTRTSLQKGGLIFSDMAITVGESYSGELKTEKFGLGFDGIIRAMGIIGIPNGTALREWNSATSHAIDYRFMNNPSERDRKLGVMDTGDGKRENKKSLDAMINKDRRQKSDLRDFICNEYTPVFCFLGRFDDQKGLNVLLSVLEHDQRIKGLLTGGRIKMVFAGTGNPYYMNKVKEIERAHPESVAYLGWVNETTAKRLFAGGDVNIMPSLFEPKGIVQMQAALFGAVNLVNKVGGLKDDIIDFSEGKKGNGYVVDFSQGDPFWLLRDAMLRIIEDFDGKNKIDWNVKVRQALADSKKFGWDLSALKYEILYNVLLSNFDGLSMKHRLDIEVEPEVIKNYIKMCKEALYYKERLFIDWKELEVGFELNELGKAVARAIIEKRHVERPLNILFLGELSHLKSDIIKIVKEILEGAEIEAGVVDIIDIGIFAAKEDSFEEIDRNSPHKDVLLIGSANKMPIDAAERMDLFIKLGQDPVSGEYDTASPDVTLNMNNISMNFIEQGRMTDFIKRGILEVFDESRSKGILPNIANLADSRSDI